MVDDDNIKDVLVLQECQKQRLFYETFFYFFLVFSVAQSFSIHQQIIETKKYFIHILTK